MQFAGQRTDMNLRPVGEPDNILVKLSEDILPQPDAILVTGITPQATLADGITEAEFCKHLTAQVFLPDTIMVGFNNLRFDNEFIRFTLWRNFYDAYEWAWKDGNSTWDLLDVVRMTRALRPDGIKWPFAPDGKPSNRLELLADVNKLKHANAHDALSDVNATIELAKLIKQKQPKLFDYLLKIRGKNAVAPIVTGGQPFVYTSGRYPADWDKTTIVSMVAPHPDKQAALAYDLRIDPTEFGGLSPAELAKRWQDRDKDAPYFPVKVLTYNKCPAIAADIRVVDKATQKRLGLDMGNIASNFAKLQDQKDLGDKLVAAVQIMDKKYQDQQGLVVDETRVDAALYDGFVNDADKSKMRIVRAADATGLADLRPDFADERLKHLLPLYKARNFSNSLTAEEQAEWQNFRQRKLIDGGDKSQAAAYFKRLSELAASVGSGTDASYLLEELNLYGQSILPA